MNRIVVLFSLLLLVHCTGFSQTNQQDNKGNKIVKTDKEWKKELTALQYYILREAGTESPFSSHLNKNYDEGIYYCSACDTPLYKSEHKFDSGTGWPSFDREIKGNVKFDVDYKIGYARTELKCNTCNGHLGHSFNDGPKETTGKRHCLNGIALKFIPKKKIK